MRSNYWSCSKLADKIRGVKKPPYLELGKWDEWEKDMKAARPVRYWLSDTFLDFLQDVVMWVPDRVNSVRYYINNRFVTKTHSLTASKDLIPRGQWCDVGNRFLPCLFSELVDFVEVESAWRWVAWDPEQAQKYNAPKRNNRYWRCPEAGIASLEWAATLTYGQHMELEDTHPDYYKLTPQATSAMEILALYRWFKDVYCNRPDVYDLAGYDEIKDTCPLGQEDNDTREKMRAVFKKVGELEEERDAEDTEMMTRLIKVRQSLWT